MTTPESASQNLLMAWQWLLRIQNVNLSGLCLLAWPGSWRLSGETCPIVWTSR
jgi:hypothetical protein